MSKPDLAVRRGSGCRDAELADHRTVAVGLDDGNVLLLDARNGRERGAPIKVAAGDLQQLVFSPDGRLLAASPSGTGVTLWDVGSRKRVGGQFPRQHGWIPGLLFQPDGRLVFFEQTTMVEWPTDRPTLQRSACDIAGRDLTRDEWKELLPTRPYRDVCP